MLREGCGGHWTGRGGCVRIHLNSPACVVISDVHRFVPATYLMCCKKRDASVRQPARDGDELDVLQLGDTQRAAVSSSSGPLTARGPAVSESVGGVPVYLPGHRGAHTKFRDAHRFRLTGQATAGSGAFGEAECSPSSAAPWRHSDMLRNRFARARSAPTPQEQRRSVVISSSARCSSIRCSRSRYRSGIHRRSWRCERGRSGWPFRCRNRPSNSARRCPDRSPASR
jgi:hypothetical protein